MRPIPEASRCMTGVYIFVDALRFPRWFVYVLMLLLASRASATLSRYMIIMYNVMSYCMIMQGVKQTSEEQLPDVDGD